jgi:hypothetical protein
MAGSGKLEDSQQLARAVVKKVHYPFWFGGSASCFAAMVTHPLDLVKVRLQTRGPGAPTSMVGTFGHILKHNGVLGLYSGVCTISAWIVIRKTQRRKSPWISLTSVPFCSSPRPSSAK